MFFLDFEIKKYSFLVNGYADATICDAWVQSPRNTRIDNSYPVFQTCETFLVPKPHILPHKWSSFLGGFTSEIWILLTLLFIILWILISVIIYYSAMDHQPQIIQTFFDLLQLLTTSDSIPDRRSQKILQLFALWSIFCCFMTMFFGSNLTSSSTIPKYSSRIDTPADFVQANLSWGSFVYMDFDIILDLSNPFHKIMKVKFIMFGNDTRYVNQLIRKNLFGIFAISYFDDTASIEAGDSEVTFKPSKLRIMRSCIYKPYIAFGFPFNSPFKIGMDEMLMRMFETGLILHYRRDELRKENPHDWNIIFEGAESSSDLEPKVLMFEHIFGAFIILGVGYALAMVVFISEICYFSHNKHCKMLKNKINKVSVLK